MNAHLPFTTNNFQKPESALLVSVPHAGRRYPVEAAAMLRVDMDRLLPLEDRHADLLAAACIEKGIPVITAQTPRLWIDLNRAEHDVDCQMIAPPLPAPAIVSHKVRSGLGLVPNRLAGVGEIWRHKLTHETLQHRIDTVHRPYHRAVADALLLARAQFGTALLIDLHSMPPLKAEPKAQIVIGDRFGRSADSRFAECARAVCEATGLRVAINSPYAGGHIIERHGRPAHGIHALQIEVDRGLYLDAALRDPDKGLKTMQILMARVAEALTQELGVMHYTEAAE